MKISILSILILSLLTLQSDEEVEARKVITSFYARVLDSYKRFLNNEEDFCCSPYLKESGNGYYLDTSYLEFLRKSGASNAFVKNEIYLVNSCTQKIKDLKNIEGIVEVPECKVVSHYRWLGGQGEKLDSFNVISVRKNDHSFEGIVWFYSGKFQFSKNRVFISEKDNGLLKIDSIELFF